MNRIIRVVVVAFVVLLAPRLAPAQDVLFYNGDMKPESPIGIQTSVAWDQDVEGVHVLSYENFVLSGASWSVTGLFGHFYSEVPFTSLFWEIRTGISEGVAGTSLASGVAAATTTALVEKSATFRPGDPTTITIWDTYVDIAAANLVLGPGTYWVGLAPVQPQIFIDGTPYQQLAGYVETLGDNGVNALLDQTNYVASDNFGYNYVESFTGPRDFSVGVIGSTVPEPATMTLLATGMLGLAAARRRRR